MASDFPPLDLVVTKQPEDCDEGRLLATVTICGVDHHLEFIRVVDALVADRDGDEFIGQRPDNNEHQEIYDDLEVLYPVSRFVTFTLPGRDGRWIAYMVPYED